jgi:hypothetical protein
MTDLEKLELQVAQAKPIIELKNQCLKLQDSPAYKAVVEEGYFKEEAARLCMAKSADLNEGSMILIDRMTYGVGAFKNYIDACIRRGYDCEQVVEAAEETRAEILREEEEEAANV